MNQHEKVPVMFTLSILMGLPFLAAWLGFTAIAAKDGREPVTAWLDPLLAGLTLSAIILVQLAFLWAWNQIKESIVKRGVMCALITSQWCYIFGEILSNTITIGEPPQDIGSLFEITAGVIVFLSTTTIILIYVKSKSSFIKKKYNYLFLTFTISLIFGLIWWFTHPIDQTTSLPPEYIPGNPVYNFFHGKKE